MAEDEGLRRRGAPNESSERASRASSPKTTAQRAVAYKPDIRVRLTVLRDWWSVFRSRYMDSVFWITCFALACQFAVVTYRNVGPVQPEVETPKAYAKAAGKAVEEAAKAAAALRVGDAALACLNYPGGWMWPLAVAALVTYLLRRKSTVYLLDFSLFEPPEEWKKSQAELVQLMNNIGRSMKSYEEPDLEFMAKVLGNSGTGDATAWPPGILQCEDPTKQQDQTMVAARHEAETVICSTLQRLFESTGLKPKQVDFLIINCSLFSPTPSLCAMASNRFGLRSNCRTFNLSGQGCSASLLSVDLAAELLQNNPCSLAVVVSTELITQSLYHGHEKAFLLQNTLFRCGGAAVALTNKASLIGRAKYRLRHLVRTQITDDESYSAVFQCEDGSGATGVRLSKKIVEVAGNAMKVNLTQLGPLVLPLSEQLRVVWSLLRRSPKRYLPSFKAAIDHFCIHAGGRAVLDGIEKNLKLDPDDMLPSRTVLRERGNTSSSSIWYELRYIEEHANIRRGHKVMQLGFGSGFKCNSAVWSRCR